MKIFSRGDVKDTKYLDEFISRNSTSGSIELNLSALMEKSPEYFEFFINNLVDELYILKKVKEYNEPIKITNIPSFLKKHISNLRSKELEKTIFFSGILKKIIQPITRRELAKFECPSCGNIITIHQDTYKVKEPSHCSCGRRGGFKIISEELVDMQTMEIEENIDDIGSRQPQKIKVMMEGDLTLPENNKLQVGNKVEILGILEKTPKYIERDDVEKNINDYIVKVIQINPIESYEEEIILSEEELNKIKDIAKDNPIRKLANNIAPGLYGLDNIKKSLVLFLAKGVTKFKDGERRRGESHLLIVGDGGLGKSMLIQAVKQRTYNCRIADGKDASKAGIVCTVSKDQYSGKWGLEAGDLVLANKGYLCIDEADKLPKSDRDALHRPMEQGIVDISKAGIHASMKSETSVFAVANPKMGMFDDTLPIIRQIDFSPTFLDRFDLIFILKDVPDELSDDRRADKILSEHLGNNELEISVDIMKKYFLYCSKLKPKLTKEASEKLKNIYTKLRAMSNVGEKRNGMPINNRHLEGLIRLSEASAKIRLSETVDECDVEIAEDLFMSSLSDIGLNKEKGTIDLSGLSTSVKYGSRNKYIAVVEIIRELQKTNGEVMSKKLMIPYIEKVLNISYSEVEKILETLHKEGQIYEPKTNYYSLMN